MCHGHKPRYIHINRPLPPFKGNGVILPGRRNPGIIDQDIKPDMDGLLRRRDGLLHFRQVGFNRVVGLPFRLDGRLRHALGVRSQVTADNVTARLGEGDGEPLTDPARRSGNEYSFALIIHNAFMAGCYGGAKLNR